MAHLFHQVEWCDCGARHTEYNLSNLNSCLVTKTSSNITYYVASLVIALMFNC